MFEVNVGDTVRLWVQFKDWDKLGTNPASVTVRVYDADMNILTESLLDSGNQKEVGGVPVDGAFFYDYTVIKYGVHTYEFSGSVGGKMSLRRNKFKGVWD